MPPHLPTPSPTKFCPDLNSSINSVITSSTNISSNDNRNKNSESNLSFSQMSDIYQCDGNVSVNSSLSDISQEPETIPVIVSCRPDNPSFCSRSTVEQKRNLIRIKRSNKVLEAGNLPIILNLNPQSLFNKSEEFKPWSNKLKLLFALFRNPGTDLM